MQEPSIQDETARETGDGQHRGAEDACDTIGKPE
jgi:hypothetical protein